MQRAKTSGLAGLPLFPLAATLVIGACHFFAWAGASRGEHTRVWLILAAGYAPLLGWAVISMKREELLVPAIKPQPGDLTKGILGCAAALMATYGISIVAVKLLPPVVARDLTGIVAVANTVSRETRAVAIVLFAVTEELVWRGAVSTALESRVGSRRAPWLASGFFVAALIPSMHPSLIVAGVAIGIVTALLVNRTGRLVPSMVAHAAYTWFVVEMLLRILVDALKRGVI